MNRLILFCALVTSSAFAADASVGSNLFSTRCASCHQARPVNSKEKRKANKNPADLAALFRSRPERINAWVLDGEVQKKANVACDTANVGPNDLANLFAFWRGQSVAPAQTRVRRAVELKEGLTVRKIKSQTTKGGAR